jgi:hypothetical protein
MKQRDRASQKAVKGRDSSVIGPKARKAPTQRRPFRKSKVALETQRAELSAHLHLFGEAAQRHPVYKRAEKLLNENFRKEKLAHRAAILKSAAWLISLLEQVSGRRESAIGT